MYAKIIIILIKTFCWKLLIKIISETFIFAKTSEIIQISYLEKNCFSTVIIYSSWIKDYRRELMVLDDPSRSHYSRFPVTYSEKTYP